MMVKAITIHGIQQISSLREKIKLGDGLTPCYVVQLYPLGVKTMMHAICMDGL